MNFPKQINVECVFCGSTEFLLPYEGFQPSENELLQCANCGKINCYSDIRDLAIRNINSEIHEQLHKMFKKAGFKVKK